MGSSTPRRPGLYQELANVAREIAKVQAAALARLDHETMLPHPLAVVPPGAVFHLGPHGPGGRPERVDTDRHLRRVYVEGRHICASLRALRSATPTRSPHSGARGAEGGYVTVLPLRVRRGIAGSLALHTARRPAPVELRRYEEVARLVGLVFELHEDARQAVVDGERARKDAAALLHGTQAALIAIRHRLGESGALRASDPARADAVLEQARDELERIGERDIGRTSRLLYPLVIRMSLTPALEALAERYAPHTKVTVRIAPAVAEMDDPFRNRLPEALRLAVYRVAEAAVARAAEAASTAAAPAAIEIAVTQSAGPTLVLTVRQTSKHRPGSEAPWRHLGNLALRLHEWGGRLVVSRGRDGRAALAASFGLTTPRSPA